LHALGTRVVAKFLAEQAHSTDGVPCVLELLAELERRPANDMIRVAGADRFPPRRRNVVPR